MTGRLEFTRRTKLQAFDRCGGMCERCCNKLQTGRIEYHHRIPCEFGGDASLHNCVVWCKSCHSEHTAKVDAPSIAKSRAVRARHIGAHKAKRPFRGWRRFDGSIVWNRQ